MATAAAAINRDRMWRAYSANPTTKLRNELVEANQRLIYPIINRFRSYVSSDQFEDVEQEAKLGLMRAVELFDLSKGFTFGTYAPHWIRQAVDRYLKNHGHTIRLPVHHHDLINSIRVAEQVFLESQGHAPGNDEELADYLGFEVTDLKEFRQTFQIRQVSSLDAPMRDGDSDSGTLAEFIPGNLLDNPQEILLAKYLPEDKEVDLKKVLEAIDSFPNRTREMVLHSANDRTLEDIGQQYGVTRERVRQIIKKAIVTIRSMLGVDADLPIRSLRLQERKVRESTRPRDEGAKIADFLNRVKKAKELVRGEQPTDRRFKPFSPFEGKEPRVQPVKQPSQRIVGRALKVIPPQIPAPTLLPAMASKPAKLPVFDKRRCIITESELEMAELIFPRLTACDDRYIDLDLVAQQANLTKNIVYLRASALIAKGVLSQDEPSMYRQGNPYIAIATGKGKEKTFREVNLNKNPVEKGGTTVVEAILPTVAVEIPQEDVVTTDLITRNTLSNEIARLQMIHAEVDRRLTVLREASKILDTPLPDFLKQ